jgi:AcrR family transcriptional regulator
VSESEGEDRRVRRTKGRLRGAIASLIHEKAYDAIAVKEILARADVGRSAFYTHFRDKDELLASVLRDSIRTAPPVGTSQDDPADAVLAFSPPFLRHVERARDVDSSLSSPARFAPVHTCLRRVLADHVAAELRRAPRGHGAPVGMVPDDLLAEHITETFLRVLTWWVGCDAPRTPEQVDAVFLALVRPALAARFGGQERGRP